VSFLGAPIYSTKELPSRSSLYLPMAWGHGQDAASIGAKEGNANFQSRFLGNRVKKFAFFSDLISRKKSRL